MLTKPTTSNDSIRLYTVSIGISYRIHSYCTYRVAPKMAPFLYALTSSHINRFSKFFHCPNQEKTCNNNITKDPSTPQIFYIFVPL